MDHLQAMLPLFKSGVDVTKVKYVPHDGGGEAMTALLGGNLAAIATDASGVSEYVKAGKVRILAVSAPTRIAGVDAPTYKEAGINGAEFTIWRGVFGPKGMSKNAQAYWSKALADLNAKPEWQAELKTQGWEQKIIKTLLHSLLSWDSKMHKSKNCSLRSVWLTEFYSKKRLSETSVFLRDVDQRIYSKHCK